jgi:signal transduction histidine kinase
MDMVLSSGQIAFVLVYFIYGLSFFTLGIAITREAWHTSSFSERRVLIPLAVFGLMHGMHEWLEIIILQGIWLKSPFPAQLSWIRVGWLAASFIPLILFGCLSLNGNHRKLDLLAGVVLLASFFVLVALQPRRDPTGLVPRIDALARYSLAVPGSLIAGFALYKNSTQRKSENRRSLSQALLVSAVGFTVYGLTQVFVSPVNMFPATVINSAVFSQTFGFPIQAIRAGVGLLITVNSLGAIKILGDEREAQLNAAKQARLEALERLQHETAERETMRRELLRHTVLAQEEERTRIARELHDETAQLLTAFSLNLATLQLSLPKKSEINQLANRLQEQSKQLSQGIYRLVHDLRPAQLDDLGLIPALQYLAEREREHIGLQVALEVDGTIQRLDPIIETVIFRVAQEALTNVGRHAGVCQAAMRIVYAPTQVCLQIKDEGVGFDLQKELVPPHGWGLAGMRERVEAVRGELSVSSAPGKGTTVEVKIPCVCNVESEALSG